MHPVQELIFDLLDETDGDESYALSESSGNTILERIVPLAGKPELAPAIAAIVSYASYLETDCKSPDAALRLMAIATLCAPLLETVVNQAKEKKARATRTKRERFGAFTDRKDFSRAAPVFGAKVAGTLKTSSFQTPSIIK